MRFGRRLWSRHTNGIKHELHLIDKRPDEDKMPKRIFQPEMFNMQDKIAEQTGILDELLTVLINKGLVGANEVKTIQEKAAARAWDVIEDFYRIDDLDEWDGF
jgi:hypothetical protein